MILADKPSLIDVKNDGNFVTKDGLLLPKTIINCPFQLGELLPWKGIYFKIVDIDETSIKLEITGKLTSKGKKRLKNG